MNLISIVAIVISLIFMTVIGAVAGVTIEHSENDKIRNILNDKYRNEIDILNSRIKILEDEITYERRKNINISVEDEQK